MSKKNEVEVIDNKEWGIKAQKGDTSAEFSLETSQQICDGLLNLGTSFITEAGMMTVEYFRTQAEMYYRDLDRYIQRQQQLGDERVTILQQMNHVGDEWLKRVDKEDNSERRKALLDEYDRLMDKHTNIYMQLLDKHMEKEPLPQTPNLLGGFGLFGGLKKLLPRK